MSQRTQVIHSDPEILGGTPVFVGTRVPGRAEAHRDEHQKRGLDRHQVVHLVSRQG